MSLAETELSVGGVKLKGVYIALLMTVVSTIGGTIWTASTLYGRLEGVEKTANKVSAITPIEEKIALIEQQLSDNDISNLQTKLTELGTNLSTIITAQGELLALKERVVEVEKSVSDMKSTIASAELIVGKVDGFESQIKAYEATNKKVNREIDDLWRGMDDLANPLQ